MDNNVNFFTKHIPNIITILSLCCGLSSIRYSILGEWNTAIFLILLAAIFDFFDGWIARKLKKGSNFGAELDSLSDFVSFGVAPSLLIYYWSLTSLKSLGWSVALFFAICSALRLARFTADIYLTPKPIDTKTYFTGVPSPAAAGLSLLPVFAFIEFGYNLLQNPYLNLFNLTLISLLMISKIPTVSFKTINITKKYTAPILLLMAIICIGLISNIWITLIIIGFVYILSIIYTVTSNIYSK